MCVFKAVIMPRLIRKPVLSVLHDEAKDFDYPCGNKASSIDKRWCL